MNKQIFVNWLRINVLWFIGAFSVALLLALLFPDTLLGFVRSWGAYTLAVGPTVLEQTSKEALFVNILTKNVFMTILYFLASLLFLAPLIAIISGTFYSLGLLSAIERGVVPVWHSPILIMMLVLCGACFEVWGEKQKEKRCPLCKNMQVICVTASI